MSDRSQRVKIAVRRANALAFRADVLVVKYAQTFYGVDEVVAQRFDNAGRGRKSLQMRPGQAKLFDSEGILSADRVLVVGVRSLPSFGYRDIREFSRNALKVLAENVPKSTHLPITLRRAGLASRSEPKVLAKSTPKSEHVAMTLHGAGYGLDEMEAFESELAGIVDAISEGDYPRSLKKISIVELNASRARRLATALESLLPGGYIETDPITYRAEVQAETTDRLRAAGYASGSKARVFVAMPFKKDMEDVYYFGIEGPVRTAGLLCERADMASYTGDVLSWVKGRIKEATMVIADLTGANANVYLEVGYAWGVGVPTVLVVKNSKQLKFDVEGQRCLVYESIKDLEKKLTKELEGLAARGRDAL